MKSVSTDSNRVVSFGEKGFLRHYRNRLQPDVYHLLLVSCIFLHRCHRRQRRRRRYDHSDQPYFRRLQRYHRRKYRRAYPRKRAALLVRGFCASPFPSASPISLCSQFRTVASGGKLIYIFVSYNVIQSVVYTMANAAMSALPTYMTNDRNSRSSCYAVRLFIAAATQTVLSLKFMNIIDALGGAVSAHGSSWRPFSAPSPRSSLLSFT